MKLSYGDEEYLMAAYTASRLFSAVLRLRFEEQKRAHSRLVGLSAFDVDKTIRLLYKLWEARPEVASRGGSSDLLGSLPVYPDFNDKHGHRVAFANVKARPAEQKYTPALEIIEMFDRGGPPASRMLAKIQTQDGYAAYVPQTTPTDLTREVLRGFLKSTDIQFVQDLAKSASALTENQIVAVGRHEQPNSTEDSLVWELARWREWLFAGIDELQGLCEGTGSADDAGYNLWQAWSFALECVKKAGVDLAPFVSDATFYAEAHQVLKEKLPIGPLFLKTHLGRSQIWRDPRIGTKRLAAYVAWLCSTYVCGSLRSLPMLRGTRLAVAFSSIDAAQVDAARIDIGRIFGLSQSSAPAYFEFAWLSSLPMSSDPHLLRLQDLTDDRECLRDFVSISRFVVTTMSDKFVAPHVASREEN